MVHSLLAAWRVSLHRTRADWPIVAAAALITLLAATLLAAGPIYSNAVSESGLHRKLATAPTQAANIEIVARVVPADAERASAAIGGLVGDAVGSDGASIVSGAVSDSFALPGQGQGEVRDLVKVGFQDDLAANATLVSGAWPLPGAAGEAIQLAVLETTATTLGLGLGDTLSLTSRTNASLTVEGVVSAVYRPTDPTAPFWWGDPALLDGLVESEEYRTFGPLFATREGLLGRASGQAVLMTWRAFPAFGALRIDELGALRARMEQLPGLVSAALPGVFATTSTGLPALLGEAERSLLASRTGVLLLLAQLAVLAGYAIALTADLIVDHRRMDTALLRSRGASTAHVGTLALAEAALLAVPAAIAGPWLASIALRLFNVEGPLAAIGLVIDPRVSLDAYLAAAGAALGCALLLVLPAFAAARSYAAEQSGRSRQGSRTLGQRLGLDIALLAVTGIGLWQLRLYGSPLTQTIQGSIGLDPLLVAAPAIGILAGSVVALRIVPLLAHAADGLAARGRHLVGSLGARQLARRPLRYTRTALLLMLAISMGVFSVSYGSTWAQSQRDQADFQVGADLRVTPATRLDAMPGWAVETAYRSIDGLTAATPMTPIARTSLRLAPSAPTGELIALDAGAASVVTMRNRETTAELRELAGALVEARPSVPVLALPGTPRRIALAATIRIDQAEAVRVDPGTGEVTTFPINPAAVAGATTAVPVAIVRDARGLLHRFTGEPSGIAPGGWQFVVPLEADTEARRATTERLGGGPAYPLEVVGVDLEISLPRGTAATAGRVALDGLAVAEAGAGGGSATAWRPLDIATPGQWSVGWAQPGSAAVTLADELATGVGLEIGSDGAGVDALPGVDQFGRGVTATFLPASAVDLAGADLAAIVNPQFLDATASERGDRVLADLPGGARRVQIIGVVDAFPTTDPSKPVVIVDLPSLGLARFGADLNVQLADEWWLDLEGAAAEAAALAAATGTGPLSGATVAGREATRQQLSTDPIALATIGALSLGFVVAGLFAVIGLTVSAAVSARQRRTEFALLRALGLSPDQLSGWLLLENGSLVVISLLAGTALGLVIGWVVLPFITVTQGGAIPFPPVTVEVPWSSILVLEVVSIIALALTLVALARSMRRAGVGSVLRMGEE